MDLSDKVLIENNKRYVVIEQVDYEGKTYLFVMNPEDENDSKFVEVRLEGENVATSKIDPVLFKEQIFPLFIEKFEA